MSKKKKHKPKHAQKKHTVKQSEKKTGAQRSKKTYNQRKKEQRIRRIALAVGATVLAFIIAAVLYVNFGRTDVREQEGMSEYAQSQIEDIKVWKNNRTNLSGCYTEEHIGVASYDDGCEYDYVKEQTDYCIDQLKSQLLQENESSSNSDDSYSTLITNAVTGDSDLDTVSLIFTYQTGKLKDGEITDISTGVKAYNFNKETGEPVLWQQLFKADYPDKLKEVLPEADTSTPYAVDGNEPTYFFTGEDNVITSKTIDSKTSEGWLRDKLLIRYVDPDKPMVALTYDDGPGLKSETRIHDVLEKYDGVATFFYAGYMIKGKEYQIKRALGNGCEIGSHTWNHPVLTKCSDKELKKQLNKTNEAIEAACGQKPTVFRPSYGATNDEINKKSGLPVILWNVDTLDWESKDAGQIYKKVVKNKHLDGSIILMHCIYDSTAEATEKIVPWLHDHGYQMVTVSELIKARTGKDPVAGKVYLDCR